MSEKTNTAIIKVVGVGGSGTNSINNMINSDLSGAEFIVANTDKQALDASPALVKLHLGADNENSTSARGLGAGANPQVGEEAAQSSIAEIKQALKGADMIIITAGMGGGTGTGAAPVFAEIAKSLGILVVAIVTTPFIFEGNKRKNNALEGIAKLSQKVDSIITISNEKLLEQYGDVPMNDSFVFADTILKLTVKTLTDIISAPAHINLDFADVKTVMSNKGNAIIGMGRAVGEDRATKAAIHAISSPIIETSIKGATDAIVNISGANITLKEINTAVSVITQAVGEDCNIIFGTSMDNNAGDDIYVSVIATGIKSNQVLSTMEKSEEIKELIKTMEIDLENKNTKEFLFDEPLPLTEKLSLTSKFVNNISLTSETKTKTVQEDGHKSKLPSWFSKKN
ncbi:cell division protein FtsZ [Mycoplasmopsis agassizii]|uniref:cell division protein FtsZ n=1 Tax=Mycoplasmopsis agassizii TaxID=33922 RepID=UPI003528F8CF